MFNKTFALRQARARTLRTVNFSSTTKYSNVFDDPGAAEFLAAAASLESIPKLHGLPEVVVTGRANVGKSTLLNAVLGRSNLVFTSKKAGRTQGLNFFRVGKPPGRLVLVDSPGYGKRGRSEWGELWNKYITTRQQLRKIILLINAEHGVKEFDSLMLQDLEDKISSTSRSLTQRVTLHVVLTKVDRLLHMNPSSFAKQVETIRKAVSDAAPSVLGENPELIITAIHPPHNVGIREIRNLLAQVCQEENVSAPS